MSAQPTVCVSAMKGMTRYAPLVGIGHFVRTYGVLAPLATEIAFTRRDSVHAPLDTLVASFPHGAQVNRHRVQ